MKRFLFRGNIWSDTEILKVDGCGVSPGLFRQWLDSCNGEDIELIFDSNGGTVTAAILIHDMLMEYGGYIHGYVDCNVYSAAFLVLLACDSIDFSYNAEILIHEPTLCLQIGALEGNLQQWTEFYQSIKETLVESKRKIIDVYMAHANSGITRKNISDFLSFEHFVQTIEELEELFDIEIGGFYEF